MFLEEVFFFKDFSLVWHHSRDLEEYSWVIVQHFIIAGMM
jgi:hypothetical protein